MDAPLPRPGPPSIPITRAVVHAGGLETPYLRLGRGPSVLVLGMPPETPREGLEPPVDASSAQTGVAPATTRVSPADLSSLAESFRVIIPLVPPPSGRRSAERWLEDLIDGLGLDRPVLLASAELAPLLLRVARRDRGRIGPTLILPLDAAVDGGRLSFEGVALLQSLIS